MDSSTVGFTNPSPSSFYTMTTGSSLSSWKWMYFWEGNPKLKIQQVCPSSDHDASFMAENQVIARIVGNFNTSDVYIKKPDGKFYTPFERS
jgi:hypothetical protein